MNNYMKTIISGLQSYIHSYTKKARGNWNQNNPDAIDYIKNRPFYSETENVVLFERSSITNFDFEDENVKIILGNGNIDLTSNVEYFINCNDNNYICKPELIEKGPFDFYVLGNSALIEEETISNNLPFLFIFNAYNKEWELIFISADVESYSFKITGPKETIVKIPEKYLPFSNSNILNGTGEGAVKTKYASEASGDYSFAEGDSTRANGPASHAEGNYATAIGDCSHAEGQSTRANGPASHAEGIDTFANGEASHAEGYRTEASGDNSHAEGYRTIASGSESHAEGNNTEAIGSCAHAEGYATKANGKYSHSEGYYTEANGNYAHAEGNYTIAYGDYSHAEGYGGYDSIRISGDINTTTYKLSGSYNLSFAKKGSILENDGKYCYVTKWESMDDGVYITTNVSLNPDKALDTYVYIYNTTAIGKSSHIEGSQTVATGVYSHAEGCGTAAYGNYSHAEGCYAKANGNYSHVEGYYTIANSDYQHVQGKYNIEDTENKYAHIIGNGDWNDRANIHTIDWHGNAWFSGDVRIGGKNYESGKKIHRSMAEVVLEPSKWNNNKQTVLVEGISSNNLKQFIQIIPNENDQENLKIIKKYKIKAVEQVENGIVFSSNIIPTSEVSFYVVWEDIDWIGAAPGLTGLIDFNYEENEDGTYTLTSWKGTFNGESSTEIRIPNDPRVIF